MKIIFIGTSDFGIPSLKTLLEKGYDIVGVITAPDKPAGRGLKITESPVKIFAIEKKLKVLQPKNLKDELFLKELKSLNADLQIVIAFRMLPEVVWQMPSLGTFNLHASLLPQYRGAAPINWAVINGEKETGVTTFFLQQEIDTGKIIFSEKISIDDKESAGQVYDRLKKVGAVLVLKTVKAIEGGVVHQHLQVIPEDKQLNKAPKIFKNDCRINWNNSAENIYNFIRGLSPYPTAWTMLDGKMLKIYYSQSELSKHDLESGYILTDNNSFVKIAVRDGFIYLSEVQMEGRTKMSIDKFLIGHKIVNQKAG